MDLNMHEITRLQEGSCAHCNRLHTNESKEVPRKLINLQLTLQAPCIPATEAMVETAVANMQLKQDTVPKQGPMTQQQNCHPKETFVKYVHIHLSFAFVR